MTTRTRSHARKPRTRRVPLASPAPRPAGPGRPVLLATDGSTAAAAAIHFTRLMSDRGSWAPEALAVGTRAAYLWTPEGILVSALAPAVERPSCSWRRSRHRLPRPPQRLEL